MKKLLFALTFCLTVFNSIAQIPSTYLPDYYKNLEKYWYYRYRLVNDFLKIGGSCGESLLY